MNCCDNPRIALVSAKCSDLCSVTVDGQTHDGYVPDDMGIGGDDYVRFHYCLECGKIHGDWPLPNPEFVKDKCEECDGEGKCPACDGSGQTIESELDEETGEEIEDEGNECDDCGGSGTCPRCDGTGEEP